MEVEKVELTTTMFVNTLESLLHPRMLTIMTIDEHGFASYLLKEIKDNRNQNVYDIFSESFLTTIPTDAPRALALDLAKACSLRSALSSASDN